MSNAWVFPLGLLLPIYTITGYDASAHTSEETLKAAHSVPRAMVMSVLWSAIFGYLLPGAFVLMIPNMDEAAKQGWNVFFWAFDQQVNPVVKEILYLAIFVAQLLCGLATVTSASRMIFAFSRDGGLPGSAALAKVSPTYRTPVAAIWTGAVLVGAVRLGLVARLDRRHLGLYDRRLLHGHLPVPLLHRPDHARPDGLGHVEMGQDGSVGSRRAACSSCSPCCRSSAMILIFVHRHPAAERLGALHHRRLLHPDGDRLVRLREPSLPGTADRRADRQAPGGDRGGRKGGRRNGLSSDSKRRGRRLPATARFFISVQYGVPTEWPESLHSTS